MDDTISRQGAIKAIKDALLSWSNLPEWRENKIAGVLDKLPSAQPVAKDINVSVKDCISRQAAIDAVLKRDANCGIDAAETLKALPSAQQERKKGKWIYNSPVTMKCNQCGFVIKDWDWHRFKCCPNCNADMRGESNG